MAPLPLEPHTPFGLAFVLCALALIVALISFFVYMIVWNFSKEPKIRRRSHKRVKSGLDISPPPASLITHGQMRLVRLDDTMPKSSPTSSPPASQMKRTLADMTERSRDSLTSEVEVVHKSQANKRLRPSSLHLSCNSSEKHLKQCEICQWEINNNQELFLWLIAWIDRSFNRLIMNNFCDLSALSLVYRVYKLAVNQ